MLLSMQNAHALFTTRIFLAGESSCYVRVQLCRTKVVQRCADLPVLSAFASTMNRIGMIAGSKC